MVIFTTSLASGVVYTDDLSNPSSTAFKTLSLALQQNVCDLLKKLRKKHTLMVLFEISLAWASGKNEVSVLSLQAPYSTQINEFK